MSDGGRERIPVLYLAPWVGYGGSDKNTIDWFRWIDRDRFAPSLIATQPSPNPLLDQVEPYAEEVWVLPDLMPAEEMPRFIFDFLRSRDVRVIHLMNSRIGFDLLPDLAALPEPPSVVVQMHAEEVDRSGYVRYVSTRYGELVDRFSMSNGHVADAVREYGVPEEKIRVIYTGIDAAGEFAPELAQPVEELADDRLQILFGARLVAQKDPLLMVDVAAALRDEGAAFQIHVVGEGDLEEQIEERIAALDLGEHVILHPPTAGLLSWYAACDVLLLTSTFEGIPVVVFEAMAMGLPIVTAGLPAIAEMLGDEDEGLVLPRDSVAGYVEPLAHLARDREHLAAWGREMRERAKEQFSVQQMAADHGELYEELVAGQGRPVATAPRQSPALPIVAMAPAADPEEALRTGLEAAEGPFVALTVGTEASLLAADPAFREKALRRFAVAGDELDAIALANAGDEGRFAFRALPPDDGPADPVPHTVIWRRGVEQELPRGLHADPRAPVASIARLLSAAGTQLEWRHLPAPPGSAAAPGVATYPPYMDGKSPEGDAEPALPGAGTYEVPRWGLTPTWVPPHSTLATRGEHVLGCLRDSGFQGTAKLVEVDGTYRTLPRESWDELGEGATELGYVELAPLPGMDPLSLAVHRASGEHVLVTRPDDPLLAEVDVVEHLGFLDPCPLKPRETPSAQRPAGLLGLTRAVDYAARRHRYAIGALAEGELVGELGALSESALGGTIPAWIVDGYLVTERHRPPAAKPRPAAAARWALEPVRWQGIAGGKDRAKVGARRAAIAAARLTRPPQPLAATGGDPAGWLYERDRPGRSPLSAAYHPVTGDQLLSRSPEDAAQLGYGKPELLGYIRDLAPVAGDLHLRPLPIPWARRFGAVPRSG